MTTCRLLLGILLILSSIPLGAQVIEDEDSTKQRQVLVETLSGKEYIGTLLSQSTEVVVIMLEEGVEISLPMDRVSSIKYVSLDATSAHNVFYHNLQASRYFFGPSGFGLKKGEGYYQNTWIFVNQASVGVTDNISIGVGVVPLFLFAGAPTPVWITPKVSIPVKKDVLNVGVGGLFGGVIGESGTFFGIAYGAFTLGNRDHNLNFSLGFGVAGGEWSSVPTITVSGMTRVGRKFYLISENYFLPNLELSVLSFGGRSLFTNISMDYGLLFPLGADVFIGIPWLGITVPFKLKK